MYGLLYFTLLLNRLQQSTKPNLGQLGKDESGVEQGEVDRLITKWKLMPSEANVHLQPTLELVNARSSDVLLPCLSQHRLGLEQKHNKREQ